MCAMDLDCDLNFFFKALMKCIFCSLNIFFFFTSRKFGRTDLQQNNFFYLTDLFFFNSLFYNFFSAITPPLLLIIAASLIKKSMSSSVHNSLLPLPWMDGPLPTGTAEHLNKTSAINQAVYCIVNFMTQFKVKKLRDHNEYEHPIFLGQFRKNAQKFLNFDVVYHSLLEKNCIRQAVLSSAKYWAGCILYLLFQIGIDGRISPSIHLIPIS